MKKSILASSIIHIVLLAASLVVVAIVNNPLTNESVIPYSWILRYALGATAVILATIKYRDKVNNGFISYGKAFLVGFTVVSLAYSVRGVYTGVVVSMNPEIMEEARIIAEEGMFEGNPDMSAEEETMGMGIIETFTSPFMIGLMVVIGGVFWAAILSLITAAILKRDGGTIDEESPIDSLEEA